VSDATWTEYYNEYEDREPREMLLRVLDAFGPGEGEAIDLGCGSGIETASPPSQGSRPSRCSTVWRSSTPRRRRRTETPGRSPSIGSSSTWSPAARREPPWAIGSRLVRPAETLGR
jgi:hypothetical protein